MSTVSGRVWKFGDDINTDLIIPGFAILLPREEQPQHCFSANRPGWVDEVLPLTMSALCRRIERIEIREYADCSRYPAPHILSEIGRAHV